MLNVDSVIIDGQIALVSVAEYGERPGDFASGGRITTFSLEEGDLHERVVDFNRMALEALGATRGVTHLELFHTPADELVFCEVGLRPGGGGVDRLAEGKHGVNMVEAALHVEAGLVPPGLGEDRSWDSQVWGMVAFYPGGAARPLSPRDLEEFGVVESRHFPFAGSPAGPRHAADFQDRYIVRAPDRASFLRTYDEMTRRYRSAEETTR